ncbi:MAG: metal-dependent phosphohydrolase [Clostridia bacterium]|nr:metal-dependent phosphohydrolase [Clostridia bacterium]MBQ5821216.1 metal-dependent phosphohydrolase [Clostridia bacterium]
MYKPEQQNENKETFLRLLRSVDRKGIENLIDYLETKTDFFTAPASTRYHNNCLGGLLAHTLNVYENFKAQLQLREIDLPEESIILTSLLHDICKCNYYVLEQRNRKVNGKWEQYDVWSNTKAVSPPLPHSYRSIRMIGTFLRLTPSEELCIYYHMGPYGGEDYEYRNLLQKVNTDYPETLLFYIADLSATYLDEVMYE